MNTVERQQVEDALDADKAQLRETLTELGDRTQSALDWRHHYRQRPAVYVAAALVGGAVLGATVARRPSRFRTADNGNQRAPGETAQLVHRSLNTFIALAAGRAVDMAEGALMQWARSLFQRADRPEAAPQPGPSD